jgi:hypothetical protein
MQSKTAALLCPANTSRSVTVLRAGRKRLCQLRMEVIREMFRDRGLFGRFKQGVGIDRVKEIRHGLVAFSLR